ncbi:MAG: DUF2225 domain-containing protein [Bacillota bacterium]
MNENLYHKEVTCPVCSKKFNVTKVKSRAYKVKERDTDFCVHYEGINPLYYDAWVCGNCGYAAQADKFLEISSREADIIKKMITPKWKKRGFDGERSIDTAIEAFKLVLLNNQLRGVKASELAKVCIRIAWLYRFKGDEEEKENEFLRYALRYYTEVYEKERFPVDKLDEYTCMYMIAELHIRTGNYDDAVKWFSKLISSAEARKKPALMEAARDRFQMVKEKL